MDDPFITVLFSALEQTRTFVACVHLLPFNCRFVGLKKEEKKKRKKKKGSPGRFERFVRESLP